MVHHDIEVTKISYVNVEKPEFDNWHVHHVEPHSGYGISPIQLLLTKKFKLKFQLHTTNERTKHVHLRRPFVQCRIL